MAIDPQSLASDLIARTEQAVITVAHLTVDTGVTFTVADIVDAVERGPPVPYPTPSAGETTRRDVIAGIAQKIMTVRRR